MKKILTIAFIYCFAFANYTSAQIKLDDILGQVKGLLGNKELLSVKKGFSPKFSLGKLQLNKVGILGEQLKGIKVLGTIFNSKRAEDITKLYKTYKTGLVVYKILAGAGAIVTTYSTVRGAVGTEKFDAKTVKQLLAPAINLGEGLQQLGLDTHRFVIEMFLRPGCAGLHRPALHRLASRFGRLARQPGNAVVGAERGIPLRAQVRQRGLHGLGEGQHQRPAGRDLDLIDLRHQRASLR